MKIVPLTIREAQAFIARHHRHHPAPRGGRFALGLELDGAIVGAAVGGRPVARHLDDGVTIEITRLAVLPDVANGCSKLYGACRRAAQALGYERCFTYILASEPGTSLRAAGWQLVRLTRNESWNRPGRARVDVSPREQKQLFEAVL